jgi:hypothetical protein
MGRLLAREIKLRGADVAPVLRALVDIARLEAGEPTSAALVAHVDAATVASRVGALQRQARAALAVVETVVDVGDDDDASLTAQAAGESLASDASSGAAVDVSVSDSRAAADGGGEA